MTRNFKFKKKIISPDYIYNSVKISKFINCIMKDGKKKLAIKIAYNVLSNLSKLTNKSSIDSFNKAIENVKPILEVKSKKIGGSNYQIPIEVNIDRGISLAIKWIISFAKKRSERTFLNKLTMELYESFNNKSNSVKKKNNIYKIAEANKAFAHLK